MLQYLNANGSSNNVLEKLPYDGSTGGPETDIGLPYGSQAEGPQAEL